MRGFHETPHQTAASRLWQHSTIFSPASRVERCMRISPHYLALPLALFLALPSAAQGQSALDLMQSIRQGGGWVSIPVAGGSGSLSTVTLLTLGMGIEGCFTVWPGHSGTWTLNARDPLNQERLDTLARPGEGVRFSYQTGTRSSLNVDVRWSEPRDTVLNLWVGLETGNRDRDACMPRYEGGAKDG